MVSFPFVVGLSVWVILGTDAPPQTPEQQGWGAPIPVDPARHLSKAERFSEHACECEDPECADDIRARMAGWALKNISAGPSGETAVTVKAHLARALECARERPVGPPQLPPASLAFEQAERDRSPPAHPRDRREPPATAKPAEATETREPVMPGEPAEPVETPEPVKPAPSGPGATDKEPAREPAKPAEPPKPVPPTPAGEPPVGAESGADSPAKTGD